MISSALNWLEQPPALLDEQYRQRATQRQLQLTKPPGSLGCLEELAIRLAAMQQTDRPCVDDVRIVVFAADHGVAVEQVSAFPQSVTLEMISNFAAGGAAINVLARVTGAQLEIVNLGTVSSVEVIADSAAGIGIQNKVLGPGTDNFLKTDAMRASQLVSALDIGRTYAEQIRKVNAHVFVGGEMGIGNTTSATALASILLESDPAVLVGPGTGLSHESVKRKVDVIARALQLHRRHIHSPVEALRRLGGFEIAALTGAYVRCAQLGVPVLIDGFISSVAALCAESICVQSKNWFIFAHQSTEPGHALVLNNLQVNPLLYLNMRLGEGSGAAVALGLLRMACALHNQMATFSSARISVKL